MSLVKLPGGGGYCYKILFEVSVENGKLLVVEKILPELGYVVYPSWAEYHIGEKIILQVKEKIGNRESIELYVQEPKEQEILELGKLIDASLVKIIALYLKVIKIFWCGNPQAKCNKNWKLSFFYILHHQE